MEEKTSLEVLPYRSVASLKSWVCDLLLLWWQPTHTEDGLDAWYKAIFCSVKDIGNVHIFMSLWVKISNSFEALENAAFMIGAFKNVATEKKGKKGGGGPPP